MEIQRRSIHFEPEPPRARAAESQVSNSLVLSHLQLPGVPRVSGATQSGARESGCGEGGGCLTGGGGGSKGAWGKID